MNKIQFTIVCALLGAIAVAVTIPAIESADAAAQADRDNSIWCGAYRVRAENAYLLHSVKGWEAAKESSDKAEKMRKDHGCTEAY